METTQQGARKFKVLMGDGSTIDLDKPEGLKRTEVAKTLARMNRFGGHIPDESPWQFYSVAEHAVLVSRLVEKFGGTPDQQLLGLSHDDHEAIIGDIITPVKRWIGADLSRRDDQIFRCCMGHVREQTGAKLSLDEASLKIVERADRMALILEAGMLRMDVRHFEEAAKTVRGLPVPKVSEIREWGLFRYRDDEEWSFKGMMLGDVKGYLDRGKDLCQRMGLSTSSFEMPAKPASSSSWQPGRSLPRAADESSEVALVFSAASMG